MKKLQVIFGFSLMVLTAGVAFVGNQQYKVSSQVEVLAGAALPPSPPTGQTTKPAVTGGGGGGGSGESGGGKGPPKFQPRVPKA